MLDNILNGLSSRHSFFASPLLAGTLLAVAFLGAAGITPPSVSAQEKETIFDRVVHLEAEIITEIPQIPRLEESLGISGKRISVGDAELWVAEEGTGIPMVLINGGPGGTHHVFHPWFGQAANFARVIYYDQRGCGLSDYEPGPDGYSVEQAVEDLEALRQALGLDRFVLLGFSYGGFLAQYYTTHYPENVAGLVLVGAAPNISADLGRSRQYEFISPEELSRMEEVGNELRDLAPDRGWSSAEVLALSVYNNHINGDWKRQHYYKPSPERMAQIALYDWVQDQSFSGIMNQSRTRVDLTGAFATDPIPTLIMEGEWDLTWGPEKRAALAANHPNGTLITFEHAGHSIYNEDPDAFFSTLRDFTQGLSPVDPGALSTFRAELKIWRDALMASPQYNLRAMDWGQGASEKLAEAFSADWVDEVTVANDYLRLGFALYDVRRYEEALEIFTRFHAWGQQQGDDTVKSMAFIWAGHMLDLLGRREEAITRYQEVVELGRTDTWSHGQYGIRYSFSSYAAERVKEPFQRIANRQR